MSDNSVTFTLLDRYSDPLKKMMDANLNFKKSAEQLNKTWNELNNKKLKLKYDDLENARDSLNNTERDARALNKSFDELYNERASNVMKIEEDLKNLDNQIEETSNSLNDLNNNASKADNNMISRLGGRSLLSTDDNANNSFMSSIKGQLGSFALDMAGTFLPESLNSGLNSAVQGAMAGSVLGLPGAVIGGVVGGVAGYTGAEVKKDADNRSQRIMFGSELLQQGMKQLAAGSINYGSEMEQTKLSFSNILKDQSADVFMGKLQEYSRETPYELTELTSMSKGMLNSGFNSEEITPALTSVGNAVLGAGGGKEDIQEVISALNQMKKSGEVTFDSLDVLASKNIDVWKILGKEQNKSEEDLRKMVSEGTIPANDAISKLINEMGKNFPNAMKAQNESFSGMISNIADGAKQLVLGPLGEGFIEGIRKSLKGFNEFFNLGDEGFVNLQTSIRTFGENIGIFVSGAIEGAKNVFGDLINDADFNNKTIPEKFKIMLDSLLGKAEEWYGSGGKTLLDSMTTYFTELLTELGKKSEFMDAVHNLWLSISPDADTLKLMLDKAGIGFLGFFIGDAKSNNINNFGNGVGSKAMGSGRIPYDNYPIIAHEGEKLLTRVETDVYLNRMNGTPAVLGGSNNVSISKLADQIVIRDTGESAEQQAYNFAELFVQNVTNMLPVYGGA